MMTCSFASGSGDLLETAGIRVYYESSTADSAIDLIGSHPPEVAIIDLALASTCGGQPIRRIKAVAPPPEVLVLAVAAEDEMVVSAVSSGASGLLLKDSAPADLVNGVRSCAAGESPVSPRIATTLLRRLRENRADARRDSGATLSAREREVLRLMVEGNDNIAIADALVISPYTVKKHVSNILSKLRVDNRLEAAVFAVRDSLV